MFALARSGPTELNCSLAWRSTVSPCTQAHRRNPPEYAAGAVDVSPCAGAPRDRWRRCDQEKLSARARKGTALQ